MPEAGCRSELYLLMAALSHQGGEGGGGGVQQGAGEVGHPVQTSLQGGEGGGALLVRTQQGPVQRVGNVDKTDLIGTISLFL